MANSQLQVFIGSSAEGLTIARTLQAELEASVNCMVQRWDVDTFTPGSLTLDALIQQANKVDYAILIATGEDTVTTRGKDMVAVRDNIIFEFGLFVGVLGRERVYLLSVGNPKIPSDLLGLTRLVYRQRDDGNIRAGLNDAVLRAQGVMERLGPRQPLVHEGSPTEPFKAAAPVTAGSHQKLDKAPRQLQQPLEESGASLSSALNSPDLREASSALEEEIELLCNSAVAQGWSVIKRNPTLLRLSSPKNREFRLTRTHPLDTRVELRKFVAELRAHGLRVNGVLRGAVEDSPFV